MEQYNVDTTLDSDNLLRDLSNVLLLRSDIHTAFDDRKFVIFPKQAADFVVHMLEPTLYIGQIYHNILLRKPRCSIEFLFARFALAIFPSLSGFLSKSHPNLLVIRVDKDTKERLPATSTKPVERQKKAANSRSSSPKKRARADIDEEDIGHDETSSEFRDLECHNPIQITRGTFLR
jgi:hypothetical protein